MEHVIGVLGSPLKNGNTALLLEKALQGAEDGGCTTEILHVPFMNFQPCMEIMHCRDNSECKMKDDMVAVYEKFREADGVIVATPVMTMGIPGKLKSFMDRFQVFFMAKYVRKAPLVPKEKQKKRKGAFIAISGMEVPYVFDGVILTLRAFYDIIDVQYIGELLVPGMDNKVDLKKFPEILDAAYEKGKSVALALKEDWT